MGFQPKWRRDDIPVMPKGRYAIMRAYMPKVGRLGLDMMLRTCTVQVNLDFASEADMVRKFRVSLALQPIATALFANSPFVEGKPTGYLSYRSHIWTDTDPDRSGMLPFVFEHGIGFERYVDYALDVPMYFVYRDGRYIDASGQSFRDFMDGRLPALPGERPTLNDWADHLTTAFPEVRLKKLPGDARRRRRPLALALRPAGAVDRAALRRRGAGRGGRAGAGLDRRGARLAAGRGARARRWRRRFRNGSVGDVAREVVAIAKAGLTARARIDWDGQDETRYLKRLEQIAADGRTPAEEKLERFHEAWGGRVDPVFQEFAF